MSTILCVRLILTDHLGNNHKLRVPLRGTILTVEPGN